MLRFLSLILLYIPLFVSAQGLKSDWLLSGYGQFDNFISSKNIQDINFRSQIGHYIGNGFCIGTIQQVEYMSPSTYFFKIEPFLRTSIFLDRLTPFLEFSAGKGYEKIHGFSIRRKNRYNYFNVKAGFGLIIKDAAILDFSLGYFKSYKYENGKNFPITSSILMGEFGLTFYLTKSEKASEAFTIAEPFLKKGNKSIGIDGGEYIIGTFLTRIEYSSMIKDRLGISLTFNNLFRHPKNGFLFRNNFNIELQPYIPLKGKCYFVPSIGIYTTSFSTSAKIKLPNTLFSNITPQMVYVGNRNILKIGIETMYNFNLKNRNIDKRLSASTMLSYHHFLSSKLAIKFEAWGNLTGLNWGQDSYIFWEPTGATHFQIGFDYFYQKN